MRLVFSLACSSMSEAFCIIMLMKLANWSGPENA